MNSKGGCTNLRDANLKGAFLKGADLSNADLYCAYFIQIKVIQNNRPEYINLPYFEKGRMYRGMKTNKEYTLEKLDL